MSTRTIAAALTITVYPLSSRREQLYSVMEERGVEPDNVTISTVLKAAEQSGAADWAWVLIEVS